MESIGLALQPRALGRGNRDWFAGITVMGAGWDGGGGGEELGVLCFGYDLCSLGPTVGHLNSRLFSLEMWFSGPGRRPAPLRGEGPTGAGIPDTGPD